MLQIWTGKRLKLVTCIPFPAGPLRARLLPQGGAAAVQDAARPAAVGAKPRARRGGNLQPVPAGQAAQVRFYAGSIKMRHVAWIWLRQHAPATRCCRSTCSGALRGYIFIVLYYAHASLHAKSLVSVFEGFVTCMIPYGAISMVVALARRMRYHRTCDPQAVGPPRALCNRPYDADALPV